MEGVSNRESIRDILVATPQRVSNPLWHFYKNLRVTGFSDRFQFDNDSMPSIAVKLKHLSNLNLKRIESLEVARNKWKLFRTNESIEAADAAIEVANNTQNRIDGLIGLTNNHYYDMEFATTKHQDDQLEALDLGLAFYDKIWFNKQEYEFRGSLKPAMLNDRVIYKDGYKAPQYAYILENIETEETLANDALSRVNHELLMDKNAELHQEAMEAQAEKGVVESENKTPENAAGKNSRWYITGEAQSDISELNENKDKYEKILDQLETLKDLIKERIKQKSGEAQKKDAETLGRKAWAAMNVAPVT